MSLTEPLIRMATDADFAFFQEMLQACSKQLEQAGFGHWTEYYTEAKIKEKFADGQIFIAELGGKPVGAIGYRMIPQDYFVESYGLTISGKNAFAYSLGVLPKCQSIHVGSKLMNHVEQMAAAQNADLYITMRAEMKWLQEFYMRRGFTIVTVRDYGSDKNGNNESYAVMCKPKEKRKN